MIEDKGHDSEGVFITDPVEVLVTTARLLITQQRFLVEATRAYTALSLQMRQTPEGAALRAHLDTVRQRTADGFPATLASLRVALEAYDTFGPGKVIVDQPDDAALWNNKQYVWTQELTVPSLNE